MEQVAGRVFEVSGTNLRPISRTLANGADILSVSQIGARLRVLVSKTAENPQAAVEAALRGISDTISQPTRPNLEDVFVLATRNPVP
jgi:ABC-2 type transport system ATP-binding protein